MEEKELDCIYKMNLLELNKVADVKDLTKVYEKNNYVKNILTIRGKNQKKIKNPIDELLGDDIIALTYRWEITKETLAKSAKLSSPKLEKAVKKMIKKGYKYAWVDWMCVPQHASAGNKEVMSHVLASRLLYANCSICFIDTVEVYPGLEVPTIDYMTRLWTTAEMSSVMLNDHANFGTFVQVTKHNLVTMALVEKRIRLSINDSLGAYVRLVEELKNTSEEDLKKQRAFSAIENQIHSLKGDYIKEKYGEEVSNFFFINTLLLSNDEKLKDQRHKTAPLSSTEQEEVITMYLEEYKRNGKEHPEVLALLEAIKKCDLVKNKDNYSGTYREMSNTFSIFDHSRALLILLYENFLFKMKTSKWNTKCFEHLLISLGEHPTIFEPLEKDKANLKFSVPKDDITVKEMLLRYNGIAELPVVIENFQVPYIPKKLGFECNVPYQCDFFELCTKVAFREKAKIQKVELSVSYFNSLFYNVLNISGMGNSVKICGLILENKSEKEKEDSVIYVSFTSDEAAEKKLVDRRDVMFSLSLSKGTKEFELDGTVEGVSLKINDLSNVVKEIHLNIDRILSSPMEQTKALLKKQKFKFKQ